MLNAGRGVPGSESKASGGAAAGPGRPSLGVTPEKIQIAQKAYARGMQYFKEQNYTKAIEFFDAAIQNNDGEPNYHARLAVALVQAKRSATRAIEAAQRAIELDPYNLEHKFILATIFVTIGSKSNAQKVYEDILRWDAGNARAQQALKELNRRTGLFSMGGGKSAAGKPGLFDQILNRFKK
ncbi:MAG: Tetratricopeptide repeat protein [candidate division BRC1 bacterium ADurb.BinA292]|nr:MAG: Tetratricopeptide repeat protein [candidate division BRC1 bacterium ADurb.BinA292]